jgi:hypothetical protein
MATDPMMSPLWIATQMCVLTGFGAGEVGFEDRVDGKAVLGQDFGDQLCESGLVVVLVGPDVDVIGRCCHDESVPEVQPPTDGRPLRCLRERVQRVAPGLECQCQR